MRHIDTEYGKKTNILRMKTEDFYPLREFLSEAGVDIRIISEFDGECNVQAQVHGKNGYWEV